MDSHFQLRAHRSIQKNFSIKLNIQICCLTLLSWIVYKRTWIKKNRILFSSSYEKALLRVKRKDKFLTLGVKRTCSLGGQNSHKLGKGKSDPTVYGSFEGAGKIPCSCIMLVLSLNSLLLLKTDKT